MIYIRAAGKEMILWWNFHIRGLQHIQMTMATPEWRSTMQHTCTWSRCLTIRSVHLLPSMHKFETLLFLNEAVVDNNFSPTDAAWQTRQNIMSSLVVLHWPHYVKTCWHPQKWQYTTYYIVVRGGPNCGHRPQVKLGHVVFKSTSKLWMST